MAWYDDISSKISGAGDALSKNVFEPMFNTGRADPTWGANQELDKIPDMLKEYLGSYMNQGKGAYDQLNPIYGNMANDPQGYYKNMLAGHKPSDAYKTTMDEALKSAGNTAAAGGYRGNINDIQNEAGISSRIANEFLNKDMQNWINNLMGIQGQGLQGLGHFYDTGYDASKNMASDLSNIYGSKAQLDFQGQSQRNQGISDFASQFLGAAPGLAKKVASWF